MKVLQNTLYVQAQGASLRLDHDAVRVDIDGELKLRAPLVRLSSLVVFGRVSVSSPLIHRCADDGRAVVWMSNGGRFKARVEGPVRGNVLLRRAQHAAASDPKITRDLARNFVAGKIQNSRQLLMRGARDQSDAEAVAVLDDAVRRLGQALGDLREEAVLDGIRGVEGSVARLYFAMISRLVRKSPDRFEMDGRSRRPPRDRMNALLSFLYALVRTECMAALEGVGLDPYVGFLHALRPGRPALALDLMEELRAPVADRLALRLINLGQITPKDFDHRPGGAVSLNEKGRRQVLESYQRRKEEEVTHAVLGNRVPVGLLPHIQARLLARTLRGDLYHYAPYLMR